MTEERLERIEKQLEQVLEVLGGVGNRLTALEQNQNAVREDIGALRNRIDSVEGTVQVAIADGFASHDLYLDDLNFDLAQNERAVRRMNRRIERLERPG